MAEERVERKLAAILAADVAEYSRLMGEDEVGTRARFNAHLDELIEPAIASGRGRIVKTTGDGLLVEFASVADAVQCAVEIQKGMAERNVDEPNDRRMEFRIGVNLGDVIIEGDDIHGDGVNVAARLEGVAEPGGICISGAVHESVRNKLDVVFVDLGEQSVKNIADPVHVFRASLDGVRRKSDASAEPDAIFRRPAVAVLPLKNLSGDPDQEYFTDGLTEDIITALSLWRSFPVIARNSTFSYKGQSPDIRKVGEELGARFVIEGSVRKAGNRIRVTVQLIDAETGHHVWAERFDRELDDILALQDEITQRVAATVEPELGRFEQKRLAAKHPTSLDAWDYCQRGMYLLYKFTKEDMEEARDVFRRAIELDPTYSQTHTGLAYSYHFDILYAYSDSRKNLIEQLMKHARQGVALDDTDSYAHVMMSFAYRWAGQHDLAIAEAERAIELNPNDAWAIGVLGNVLDLAGRPQDGIPYLKQQLRLNPRDVHSHFMMAIVARAYLNSRDYQSAKEWARRAINRDPNHARAHLFLASSLGHLGKSREASEALDECNRVNPDFVSRWTQWREFRNDVDNDHILDGLRKAGLPE